MNDELSKRRHDIQLHSPRAGARLYRRFQYLKHPAGNRTPVCPLHQWPIKLSRTP
jgi:hypothetical protein